MRIKNELSLRCVGKILERNQTYESDTRFLANNFPLRRLPAVVYVSTYTYHLQLVLTTPEMNMTWTEK